MSLYDDASLIVYPSGYKDSKIYSQKPVNGTGDLDYERASTATRINESGLIESVATNLPRIDYTGGGCGSLLLEPQRANLITESQDFSGNWSTSAVTINSNAATSPDGATNASKVTPTTSTSVKYISTTAAVVSGVDYTFSFFAKAGGYDYVSTYISALGITGGNWNLATGAATGAGRSMEDYGNGWWRCIGTGTSTGNSASCRIYSHPTASSSFTGNGVDGVYIYGAQVEAGSYPTSYIPTSSTTVTRNRDKSITGGLSSVINSVEGVIFLEMAALANDSTNRYISINNGTSSKRIIIKFGTSSNNISALGLGTASAFSLSYSGATITNMNKIALKYKANDCALWINGVEVATDTTFTAYAASTLTTIVFSNFSGGGQWLEAKVQNLMVFPSALTDIELAALTT